MLLTRPKSSSWPGPNVDDGMARMEIGNVHRAPVLECDAGLVVDWRLVMSKRLKRGRIVVAAVAAAAGLWMATQARAQYAASGQDGHANDANNRVGSGGYNGGGSRGTVVTPNDIVNRNVTGGREFRGRIGERDPQAFTGPTAGRLLDVFNRQTNGVSDNGLPNPLTNPQPYYSDASFTRPPAGSIPNGFNGGYIGTTLNSPSSLSNSLNVISTYGLQSRTDTPETLRLNQFVNPTGYGELSNSELNNSTLADPSIYGQSAQSLYNFDVNAPGVSDQFGIGDQTVQQIRGDLQQNGQASPNGGPRIGAGRNGQGQGSQQNLPPNSPVPQPLGTISNDPINGNLSDARLGSGAIASSSTISLQPGGPLIPPEQQSAMLSTLQQRLALSTPEGRALYGQNLLAPGREAPGRQAPGRQSPAPRGGTDTSPVIPPNQQQLGPVTVSHLAEGVKVKSLHDLLASAEELAQQGQYDSAIGRFTQAQRGAPNNPLGQLGRADAELAGGYYARAELDLRSVLRSSPQLAFAQIDLNAAMPQGRADYLRKDLQELARQDPTAERPWFLLAYLDYNTGDAAGADAALKEAAKRTSKRGDPVITLLQERWALPSNGKAGLPTSGGGTPATPAAGTTEPATAPQPSTSTTPAEPQPTRVKPLELNK